MRAEFGAYVCCCNYAYGRPTRQIDTINPTNRINQSMMVLRPLFLVVDALRSMTLSSGLCGCVLLALPFSFYTFEHLNCSSSLCVDEKYLVFLTGWPIRLLACHCKGERGYNE